MAAIVTAAPVKTGPACRDDDGQPLHGYGLGPVPLFMCIGELGELGAGAVAARPRGYRLGPPTAGYTPVRYRAVFARVGGQPLHRGRFWPIFGRYENH